MTPKYHAELIKKWADGAEIQFYNRITQEWSDIRGATPAWSMDVAYRLKPGPLVYESRVKLFSTQEGLTGIQYSTTNNKNPNLRLEFDQVTNKLISATVIDTD